MAEPLYSKATDPITGEPIVVDAATGQNVDGTVWQVDPTTGYAVKVDAATGQPVVDANGMPVSRVDPSLRSESALIASGNAAPNSQPVAQDPYTDMELSRGLGSSLITHPGTGLVPGTAFRTPPPADAAAMPVTDFTGDDGGYDSGYGGYTRRQYGGYGRSGYGGYSGGGYADGPTVPRYANGAMHPFFGGQMPQPGGGFADGYDNRQQVTSTSGATAGPFEVSAARAPRESTYGSGGGGGGGGGGGIARDLYWQFAGKLKDKLMGGGSSYSGGSYKPYKPYTAPKFKDYPGPEDPRVQRRIANIYPRTRGPYVGDWTGKNAEGLYDNPTPMLLQVAGPGYTRTPGYEVLGGMDWTNLALLSGAGIKGWAGGMGPFVEQKAFDDYYKKMGKVYKAREQFYKRIGQGATPNRAPGSTEGINFTKFYKHRIRKDDSLSDFGNTLGRLYDQYALGGRFLDTRQLLANLMDPAKGTYYERVLGGTKREPVNTTQQADTFLGGFNALLGGSRLAPAAQDAFAAYAQDLANRQILASKGQKKPPALNAVVGNALRPYF